MPRARRTTGRILLAALAALAGASSLAAPPAAEGASLPLFTKVRTVSSGDYELRLRVSASTRPGARCRLTVRSGRHRLDLPPLVASEGLAAWEWIVPRGAPSGRWRFVSRCAYRGRAARRVRSALVLVPSGSARTGLLAPGTIAAAAGRFAGRAPRQVKPPPREESKGAGANPGERGYCTWGAYNRAPWLGAAVRGHANNWYASAKANGLPVGDVPIVGAVFVRTSGKFGHVGIVTGIVNATTFTTEEMNGGGRLVNVAEAITDEFDQYRPHVQNTGPTMKFIYKPGTQPGAWTNQIVQWDGDPKQQKTAWMVGPDNKRRWIPDAATFWCLKGRGVPGPTALPPVVLDQYPDLTHHWVTCGPGGVGLGSGTPPSGAPPGGSPPIPPATAPPKSTGSPPATTAPPTTTTPPPTGTAPPLPRTWPEQQGSLGANTFSNPHNASGMGPRIGAMTWVEVSCKVHAPAIASANPDGYWYRIASPPWNNQFYAVANTFWNGDVPGQKPYTHNTDMAVPNC